jgi:hypothetical protein
MNELRSLGWAVTTQPMATHALQETKQRHSAEYCSKLRADRKATSLVLEGISKHDKDAKGNDYKPKTAQQETLKNI